MKKRTYTLLNFFALNILFFAIYLNFIHKDINTLSPVAASTNAAVKNFTTSPSKSLVTARLHQPKKTTFTEN